MDPVRKGGFSGLLSRVSKIHGSITTRKGDESMVSVGRVRKESIRSVGSTMLESVYSGTGEEEMTEDETETQDASVPALPAAPADAEDLKDLWKYSMGTPVEAHGLIEVQGLNGKRGVVVDDKRSDGRVVVDFGPPFGRRALRLLRLTILDLEHDLSIMYTGLAKWFRCVFQVGKVSPNQRKVVGSLARRETRLWVVDLLTRHIYRPAFSTTASEAIHQITDPTTKTHAHTDLIKIERNLSEPKRLILRCHKTGHEHDLEFANSQERQRFYECAKAMRMDLVWCPYMALTSHKPCTVGVSGSAEVPLVHGTPGESQRMSGETRMHVTPQPTAQDTVWVGSLDVTDTVITVDDDMSHWLAPGEASLVVIGLVGVSHEKEKKDKDPEKYGSIFTEKLKGSYMPLLSTEISGGKRTTILMVYIRRALVPHVSNITAWSGCHTRTFKSRKLLGKSQSVSTDMVTASFVLRESPVCFICTSLKYVADGASDEATTARNEVLRQLLEKADMGLGGDILHRYHHVFVMGGLGHGYRGGTTPDQWTTLSALPRGGDRLTKEVAVGNILTDFTEGDMTLDNTLGHASLEQRVLWKSNDLYDIKSTSYTSHGVAGMPAVASFYKLDTQLLFCETFSRPCAKRSVMLDKCIVRVRSERKLTARAYVSGWAAFADAPSLRCPDMREEGGEYHGGAFPVIDPINHSAEHLARQEVLLSVRDKDELLGTCSITLRGALEAPGQAVRFEGSLTRGGVAADCTVSGTLRITEDVTPLIQYEQDMKAQFKATLAMLVKEEEMGRAQIIREELMNAEPLAKMDEQSRIQSEARYKERILRLRAACRTLEKSEEAERIEVEQREAHARGPLLEQLAVEQGKLMLLKERWDLTKEETKLRVKIKTEEEKAWRTMAWKQEARSSMMKDERGARDDVHRDERSTHAALVTAAASAKMKIRRQLEEARQTRIQQVYDFTQDELTHRHIIQEEEEEARCDLEILMTNDLFGTRKVLNERIGSEEECRSAIMSLETAVREKVEDEEDDRWFSLVRWSSDVELQHRNRAASAIAKDELERRTEMTLEEKVQWENIIGEEAAAWRKAARDTARVSNKTSYDAALLSRKSALRQTSIQPKTAPPQPASPPSEYTAASCGQVSPDADPDPPSLTPLPQTPSPYLPPPPTEVHSDVVTMLRAADDALARLDARLGTSPPRMPPSPPASPPVCTTHNQCLSRNEASELRSEVAAHRLELSALRETLTSFSSQSPIRSVSHGSPNVADFETRVQSLEQDVRLTALEARVVAHGAPPAVEQASDAAKWRAAVTLVDQPESPSGHGCPTCGHDAACEASALLNKNNDKQRLLVEALARVSRLKSSASRHLSPTRTSPGRMYPRQSRHRSPSPPPSALMSPSLAIRGKCRAADSMSRH